MAAKGLPPGYPVLLLFIVLACTAPFTIGAQSAAYYTELRFFQRLSWIGDANTWRYEVVIESETGGVYRQVSRESTEDTFLIVSLHPGVYRYRVIPYDFLGRPGQVSPWVNITVLTVADPVLTRAAPNYYILDDAPLFEINIYGYNISPDARIYLRRLGGQPLNPDECRISGDGTNARLIFRSSLFVPGEYEIVVINPGGAQTSMAGIYFSLSQPPERYEPPEWPEQVPLPEEMPELSEMPALFEYPYTLTEPAAASPGALLAEYSGHWDYTESSSQGLPVEYPEGEAAVTWPALFFPAEYPESELPITLFKALNIYGSFTWTPAIPIYGSGNQNIGRNVALNGWGIRLGIVSAKPRFINMGTELSMSWSSYPMGLDTQKKSLAFALTVLSQKRFSKTLTALNLRLGAGFSLTLSDSRNDSSSSWNKVSSHANMGFSLYLPFGNRMYFEPGLEYIHLFRENAAYLRPWVGIGLRF